MSFNKRFFPVGGIVASSEAACLTDTTDIFGDSSGVALYSLDYDGSDASGNYDGTPTNVEFGVGGQINYGARFNGSSSYIDTGIGGSVLGELFSVSFWFKTSTTGTFQTIFDNGGNTSASTGFAITIPTDNILKANFTNSGGGGGIDVFTLSTNTTVTDGNWHHCVITYNDESVKIYLDNGTPITGTNTEPFTQAANNLRIGAYYADGNLLEFNGSLDQVRIFDKALSSSEVSTLYAETACVYECTTDTVDFATTNLAYYKLDNSAEDETGTYDGAATNVNYAFGRFGQAAVFNGSSSVILVEDSSANAFGFANHTGTASAWVNINSFSAENNILAKRDIGNPGNRHWMLRVDTSNNINFYIYNTDTNQQAVISSTVLNANQWYHIAVTLTTSDVKIYINGVEDTTASSTYSTIQNDGADLQIGRRGTNTSHNYFDGKIDQVRIFSTALTSDQVTQLYEEKQCFDTVTEPTGNLRFDEFWAGYDDGQTNRAEFKLSGKGVDFNTYSEGHAVLNQNPQTSGKYYLEIKLVGTSGHDLFGVFNRSTNTDYDVSPYAQKNPIDANYGAFLYARGSGVYIGNVSQSGFTNLSLTDGDIVCMAVNVDEKRIWWGRRDGLSDSSVTWNSGNPNGGYGGLEVSFVPSDVIVAHTSETLSRFSEFEVLDHADMLEPPFNFSYLDGAFTASLTENEANF